MNEFEPEWLSPVRGGDGSFSNITVSDDLQVGSVISVFEATDQDAGNDGIIKYHLNAVTKGMIRPCPLHHQSNEIR